MNREQILIKPVITEKSLALASLGKYTFYVDPRAKKGEIAGAIEHAFSVHVLGLTKINLKGKKRRAGKKRQEMTMSIRTKAIARLAPTEKIDLFTVTGEEASK